MRRPPNYYSILGVTPSATAAEIARARRARARLVHPDLGEQSEFAKKLKTAAMISVNLAEEVLADPEKRRAHDAALQAWANAKARAAKEREADANRPREPVSLEAMGLPLPAVSFPAVGLGPAKPPTPIETFMQLASEHPWKAGIGLGLVFAAAVLSENAAEKRRVKTKSKSSATRRSRRR